VTSPKAYRPSAGEDVRERAGDAIAEPAKMDTLVRENRYRARFGAEGRAEVG
jgi:hypothetical protein